MSKEPSAYSSRLAMRMHFEETIAEYASRERARRASRLGRHAFRQYATEKADLAGGFVCDMYAMRAKIVATRATRSVVSQRQSSGWRLIALEVCVNLDLE